MAAAAPAPISREVFVHIIVDQGGNISVHPEIFWVSQGGNQEVMWYCTSTNPRDPHPNFTVVFNGKNGSPFYESEFNRANPYSGLVRRTVRASSDVYEYTVEVVGAIKPADPFGGVDP